MNPGDAVGFVGLGRVGQSLARRLVRAGYAVAVFDEDAARMEALAEAGARSASGMADAARDTAAVLVCLPAAATTVAAFDEELLPAAVRGQAYIDLGGTGGQEARRLHRLFAERGAAFLDAPLSGAVDGEEPLAGAPRLCVGGVRQTFDRWEGLLKTLLPAGGVVYCGPGGSGQAVHAARQLALGLRAAGFLEALALARAAGVEAETVRQALGDGEVWERAFVAAAAAVDGERVDEVEAGLARWDSLQQDAAAYGLDLPLAAALDAILRQAATAEDASFWGELGRRRGEILKARYLGHGKGQDKD